MGQIYSVSKDSAALSASDDFLTITAPAGRSLKIHEISVTGMGTVSAANEIKVARSSSGTTPTAVTPAPLNPNAPSASFTAASAWSTPPTLGAVLLRLGVNANGGAYRWVAKQGCEIEIPGGGQVSIRGAGTTSTMTMHALIEEI